MLLRQNQRFCFVITNNYEANNGNLTSITYGNNQTISYTRDRFNRLTKTTTPAGTYDAIGNPLTYDGNTYTWKNGRELGRIQNTSKNTDISYKYNDSGIRIEKTVNGTTTKYHLDGTKVIYEQTGNDMTRYMYDEAGQVIGMEYNGTAYYYVKNGQGDVIGLLDNNLNEVARYTYDSWGKVISVTNSAGNAITDTNNIAHKNPYRYRGYRYDTETGLYYLQSRYYNPEWSRFVNADGMFESGHELLGNNLYTYCSNNPVNNVDVTGHFPITIGTLLGIAITAIAVAIIPTETWENIGQTIGNIATAVVDTSKTVVSNIKNKVTSTKKTSVTTETITVNERNTHDLPIIMKSSKHVQPPSKLKYGNKVKTPDSHPTEFAKNKNSSGYTHKKTGWNAKKDPSQHGGPHWDMKPPRGSGHINVGPEGNIFGGSR